MVLKMTETEFRDQQIIPLAKLHGWKYYFTWKSYHSPKGFPDMVLVRGTRLIFAELKKNKGKVTPEQCGWLDALSQIQSVFHSIEVYVWRPSDWDDIVKILE